MEHNFNDRLSHSEETLELRRARQRDSAPGEETPELRGAILIDSAVTQGQMGTVPDSGTLGHTIVTKGDFGHTMTRVLQATNLRAGGLQPKDCTKRLGHARDSVDQQWAPSPELDKDCSGTHSPRTAHGAPSPGLERRLGQPHDWAHQRDADHPRTAGDADNPELRNQRNGHSV